MYFGVGDVVFDVVFLEPGEGEFESYNGVCQFTVS